MRVTITYCRYYMQRELRREKRFRYRGVTVTANAVIIPLDPVLVSRSNGYGLRTNCSGQESSKRRIATTQNFCPTIAVSAVTITVSVVTIQVYFSPCRHFSEKSRCIPTFKRKEGRARITRRSKYTHTGRQCANK